MRQGSHGSESHAPVPEPHPDIKEHKEQGNEQGNERFLLDISSNRWPYALKSLYIVNLELFVCTHWQREAVSHRYRSFFRSCFQFPDLPNQYRILW